MLQVLCSRCCNEKVKYKLEYLDAEARVCQKCYNILSVRDINSSSGDSSPAAASSSPDTPPQPNPNNPMEYCSMVPPYQQVSGGSQSPPSVMVPVGVLKRKGTVVRFSTFSKPTIYKLTFFNLLSISKPNGFRYIDCFSFYYPRYIFILYFLQGLESREQIRA